MKYLTLIRHAKSSWKHDDLDDKDRPLNDRGKRAIKRMAPFIRQHTQDAQCVFSSDARRTRCTVEGLQKHHGIQQECVMYDADLYTFEAYELIEWIRNIDNSQREVVIVGHNPALSEAIEWLCGEEISKFPTLALAKIFIPKNDWQDLESGIGRLEQHLYPSLCKHEI